MREKLVYYTLNVFDCSTAEMTANIMDDFQKLGLPDNVKVEVVYESPTKEDLDDPTFRGTPAMRETKMGQRLIEEHMSDDAEVVLFDEYVKCNFVEPWQPKEKTEHEDVNPEELRQWREVEEEHGYYDDDIYERDYR